jgi:RNA polymerase sigma-70 factor (ECF subfamily)
VSEQEFRRLVEEHYDRLFRAARFMCGDPQAAEDLLHDTFLAAARSLERFRGRSSAYTWLYGIMLNKFRRYLRRKGSRALSLQAIGHGREDARGEMIASETPGPVERLESKEAARRVREAIQELSPDHRSVVTLRFLEGLPYAEIAEMLDCPVGTVKSRIHYALQNIERHLAGGGGGSQ